MTIKKPTAAEVTAETIKAWKEQYPKVVRYKAEDGKEAYFRSPDLTMMDAAAVLGKTNPFKSNLMIAKACFLGGDEEVINDEKYFFGLNKHIALLVASVEGELSEL